MACPLTCLNPGEVAATGGIQAWYNAVTDNLFCRRATG